MTVEHQARWISIINPQHASAIYSRISFSAAVSGSPHYRSTLRSGLLHRDARTKRVCSRSSPDCKGFSRRSCVHRGLSHKLQSLKTHDLSLSANVGSSRWCFELSERYTLSSTSCMTSHWFRHQVNQTNSWRLWGYFNNNLFSILRHNITVIHSLKLNTSALHCDCRYGRYNEHGCSYDRASSRWKSVF